jgi:hypothetical protein
VPSDDFFITYAAHTSSCTFLLDDEGICRRIVLVPKGKRRDSSQTAARCVGAQYVASLDAGAAGGLIEMPRVGSAMLFARVDEHGRVSLVRTGVVTQFEAMQAEDPFAETSGVATSAPELLEAAAPLDAGRPADPDYFEAGERTQRIPALRAEDLVQAMANRDLDRTSEYGSPPAPIQAPQPQTLRNPRSDAAQPTRSARTRGIPPRQAEAPLAGPGARTASNAAAAVPTDARRTGSNVRMVGRRR